MRIAVKAFLAGALIVGLNLAGLPATATTDPRGGPTPASDPSIQIIGGRDATEPYPFIASLQTLGGGHFCGAALIRSQWLYTAKHCVADEGPGTFRARIGSLNRTSGGTVVTAAQVIVNPSGASDAALVKLASPVSHTPIDLASATPIGSAIRLLGWGAVCDPESCPPPTILKELDTDIRPDSQCGTGQVELCVGNPSGWQGACYGDSGGPALIKAGGVWHMAGGTHAGTSSICGQGPSIYTDAPYHKSWVEAIVGPGNPPPPPPPGCTQTNGTDVAIPDLSTVESGITISGCVGNASATSTVEVHIVHTYIGDLIVTLVAPDGSTYVLHNRAGGSADNINQTYPVNLSSEAANGAWKLRVQDGASSDIGRIDSWTLALGGGGTQPCSGTNGTNVTIPDNTTVTSTIAIAGCTGNGSTASTVEVHIVHTYIGDLIVTLVAPDGSTYVLHNQAGGSADNINQTYTLNLSSEAKNGTWTLRVQDAASSDIGYIDSWTLAL